MKMTKIIGTRPLGTFNGVAFNIRHDRSVGAHRRDRCEQPFQQ